MKRKKETLDDLTADPSELRGDGRLRVTARRVVTQDLTVRTAREWLEPLQPGGHVFGVTKGDISMIDLVMALVERAAPATMVFWTWCIAAYEVQSLHRLIDSGHVDSFRLVIDGAAARVEQPLLREIQRHYGDDAIRLTRQHAKIAVVRGAGLAFCVRGSMNLNYNPRLEQCDVSEGDGAAALIEALTDEIWAKVGPLPVSRFTNAAATDIFDRVGPPEACGWMDDLKTMV